MDYNLNRLKVRMRAATLMTKSETESMRWALALRYAGGAGGFQRRVHYDRSENCRYAQACGVSRASHQHRSMGFGRTVEASPDACFVERRCRLIICADLFSGRYGGF